MNITHLKVSPVPAPTDPDALGGPDWNEPHVITGPRLAGGSAVYDNSWAVDDVVDDGTVGGLVIVKKGAGQYQITGDGALKGAVTVCSNECHLDNLSVNTGVITVNFLNASNVATDPAFWHVMAWLA